MKKYLLLLLPLLAVLNSCTKITGVDLTGTSNGISASYQPLTAGSTWQYSTDYSASLGFPLIDTDAITMTAKTLTISSKVYNQAYETHAGFGITDTGYYHANNHEYSIMQKLQTSTSSGYAFEMLYLKDNVAVGTTWTANTSNTYLGNIQLTGKIVEKGISKTVAGKTYTNVIHTNLQLVVSLQGTTTPIAYDIYVAQGVGIVRIELNETGYATIPQDLIAYTIK
jgi:hypothetical protein